MKNRINDPAVSVDNPAHYEEMKSTIIMGASSVVNIILGIIRNKLIAVLLNPAGVGLLSVYQSIANMASTVSGAGINESGARQMALAFHAGDKVAIVRTLRSLRQVAFLTGIFGTILLLLSSQLVSILTFGTSGNAREISILSITILFGAISGGQLALIQGARKINYLAKINVLGPLYGTILSLPIIYFWGMQGVVSYLIIMAVTNVFTSWWYSTKLRIPKYESSLFSSIYDAKPLFILGGAFMLGNLAGVAVQYLLRVMIIRLLTLHAAGEYQAAALLSTVYVGILLKAMATDFYPRLSAASGDDKECAIHVNKQINTGLLFATPGIVATLALAPLLIVQLYSREFILAADVLRWQILGVFLLVITWPMGYILRAKADGKLFVVTEILSNFLYLAFAWVGIQYFGLPGVGIAFFAMNAVYAVSIYWIVRNKYGFGLSEKNLITLILLAAATGWTFLSRNIIPKYHIIVSIMTMIIVSAYCMKSLALYSILARILSRLKKKGK